MLFNSIFRKVNVTLLCIPKTPTMLYAVSPEKWSFHSEGRERDAPVKGLFWKFDVGIFDNHDIWQVRCETKRISALPLVNGGHISADESKTTEAIYTRRNLAMVNFEHLLVLSWETLLSLIDSEVVFWMACTLFQYRSYVKCALCSFMRLSKHKCYLIVQMLK